MLEAWNEDTRRITHGRWQSQLRNNLPIGVPVREDDPTWPDTFRSPVDEIRDENLGECRQCLLCRYYCELEGPLGMDWGACLKPGGQYDRQVVFEHWTCRDFEYAPDSQSPRPDWYRLLADSHARMAADLASNDEAESGE